ncbi:MAG: hypothetical protein U5K79_01615 [Cyclobacteriaceae bacterium]|nr:hypothetical protein [Cyclobacteriaceae bacterium]
MPNIKNGAYEEALKDITTGQVIAEDPDFINKINPFVIKILGLANKEQVRSYTKAGIQKTAWSVISLSW